MSLLSLPAEVQKSILESLDYSSLCRMRTTCRYFGYMLTEAEIHAIFLNIDVPSGIYSYNPTDGQTCAWCARYCDATKAQENNTKKLVEKSKNDFRIAFKKLRAAKSDVKAARNTLTQAKAAVKATRVQKDKKAKRVQVAEAQEKLKVAIDSAKAAEVQVELTRSTSRVGNSPDNSRTCQRCNRKHNGYENPGVFSLNATVATLLGCVRTIHHDHRLSGEANAKMRQGDGKICKICWKGGRRGASGVQRRRTFVEEYGYWLRDIWVREGEAINTNAKMLANKSFEDIESEMREANAAKTLP